MWAGDHVVRGSQSIFCYCSFLKRGMEPEPWIGKAQNKNRVLYMRGWSCSLKDTAFSLGTTANNQVQWKNILGWLLFSFLEEKGIKVGNIGTCCLLTICPSYQVDRAFSNDCKGSENHLTENHILWTNELQNSIFFIFGKQWSLTKYQLLIETESGQLKTNLVNFSYDWCLKTLII